MKCEKCGRTALVRDKYGLLEKLPSIKSKDPIIRAMSENSYKYHKCDGK